VAVDGSGNVIVADTQNSAVKEIVAASDYTTVKTLGGGFNSPAGVAVDGSGNVFVANTSNGTIKEIVAVNGSIPASPTIRTLGSGLNEPSGVAVDGSGDVFVADIGNNTVKELDFADPPSLSFASATLGSQSSDSPLSVTVSNNGNADLTFPVLAVNNPSVASGFTLDNATTCPQLSTISAAGTLAAGTSCAYAVDFIAAAFGSNSGSLVLTDNNLNAASPGYATQSIGLSGTGTGTVPDAPTIGTATAGDAQASVSFTPPTFTGGATITGYTATSSPGAATGTCALRPAV
jgi:hypothetical protein